MGLHRRAALEPDTRERQLTTTEALAIMEQTADARGRGPRPGGHPPGHQASNIMLDADGGVHMMDFGLAKTVDLESKHTARPPSEGRPCLLGGHGRRRADGGGTRGCACSRGPPSWPGEVIMCTPPSASSMMLLA